MFWEHKPFIYSDGNTKTMFFFISLLEKKLRVNGRNISRCYVAHQNVNYLYWRHYYVNFSYFRTCSVPFCQGIELSLKHELWKNK